MEHVVRLMRLVCILMIAQICGGGSPNPIEVKVIANLGLTVTEVSRSELQRIYLMTKTSAPGVARLEPVLESSGRVNKAFFLQYVGRTEVALMAYYRSLVFTGKANMPKTFDSDAEVVAYIAKTKGAIGYVSASTSTSGVRMLRVK